MSIAQPPRRPALLALVLAAHAALLLGWQLADRTRAVPAAPESVPPLVMLRLPLPLPRLQMPRERAAPSARERRPAAVQPLQPPTAVAVPAAPAIEAPSMPAATAPEPPASAPLLRLDLGARRGGGAPQPGNPALNDPRANSPRKTIESRIASVTGDGRVTEEMLPDGTRLYRRGSDCVRVVPSRAEGLFPFNASVSKPPPVSGSC